MNTKQTRFVIAVLAVLLLAACQPLSSSTTPDPASQGFEALPPPTDATAFAVASEGATTLGFTTGELCQWLAEAQATSDGAELLYHCGTGEGGEIALLGPVESTQGQAFSVTRALVSADAGEVKVSAQTQLPFNIEQVVLENGATCVNVGEGSNEIVDEARISFTCEAASPEGAPDAGVHVLVNGLYPGEDGVWSVDSAVLTNDTGTAALSEVTREPIASVIAQPLVVSVGEEVNGKTIYLTPAQVLEVTLESNPTTGYAWSVAPESTAPLTEAGEPVYEAVGEVLPGSGGVEHLYFDVAGAGSGELILNYARAFETGATPVETYVLNIVVALTATENGSDVAIENGDTLAVLLPANPTTGFSWQVVDNDGSVLAQTSDPVTMPATTAVGAGGMQLFTFEGVAAGSMTLQMVYARPWESDSQPASTYMLNVTVE